MARLKQLKGLTEFSTKLATLGQLSQINRVFKVALFDGAAVVADTLRQEIESLPTGREYGTQDHPSATILPAQKRGLQDGMGIAEMKNNGEGWDTMVGFTGYNSVKTSYFPSGQPNAMIAASVEGGTSTRQRNAFITRALRKSREKANAAMAASADGQINQIMEER